MITCVVLALLSFESIAYLYLRCGVNLCGLEASSSSTLGERHCCVVISVFGFLAFFNGFQI